MTNADNNGNNGHHAAPTRMDALLDTVATQSQQVEHVVADLIAESSRRQLVIRNLDDAVILEVPLNGVIVGSLVLTIMMRLRWVVVLALLTLFGRFYVTIERVEAAQADQDEAQGAEAATATPKRTRRPSSKSQRLEA